MTYISVHRVQHSYGNTSCLSVTELLATNLYYYFQLLFNCYMWATTWQVLLQWLIILTSSRNH